MVHLGRICIVIIKKYDRPFHDKRSRGHFFVFKFSSIVLVLFFNVL